MGADSWRWGHRPVTHRALALSTVIDAERSMLSLPMRRGLSCRDFESLRGPQELVELPQARIARASPCLIVCGCSRIGSRSKFTYEPVLTFSGRGEPDRLEPVNAPSQLGGCLPSQAEVGENLLQLLHRAGSLPRARPNGAPVAVRLRREPTRAVTRSDGVPGSIPGVGSPDVRGFVEAADS